MSRLIGLTQRLTVMEDTGEKRDSLARDWRRFMSFLGLLWVALPNDADYALDLVRRLSVGALVLTGGGDLGQDPERDATERALLDQAARDNLPVLGVCRGFQAIQRWLGGGMRAVDPVLHRARRHDVLLSDGTRREVNSWHNFAPDSLPSGLEALARCPVDGCLEAAAGQNLLGLMWHPEREAHPAAEDAALIVRHLQGGV